MGSHSLGKGPLNTRQEWHHGHGFYKVSGRCCQTLGRKIALGKRILACVYLFLYTLCVWLGTGFGHVIFGHLVLKGIFVCSGHLCAVPFYTEGFQGINYKKRFKVLFINLLSFGLFVSLKS